MIGDQTHTERSRVGKASGTAMPTQPTQAGQKCEIKSVSNSQSGGCVRDRWLALQANMQGCTNPASSNATRTVSQGTHQTHSPM